MVSLVDGDQPLGRLFVGRVRGQHPLEAADGTAWLFESVAMHGRRAQAELHDRRGLRRILRGMIEHIGKPNPVLHLRVELLERLPRLGRHIRVT